MSTSPLVGALALGRGSARLLALRFFVLVGLLLPAFAAGRAGWSARVGADPRFVEPAGALPLADALDGLMNLSPASLALLALAVVAFWLFDQLLLAAAFRVLAAHDDEAVRLWRRLWSDGWTRLLPYLRVALVGLVAAGIGLAIIGKVFERLDVSWQAAGATGEARLVTLSVWRVLVMSVWLGLVGALGFWCRALLALDERVRVRRVILEVARVFVRAPLSAPILYLVVTSLLQLAGPFLLLRAGAPTPGVTDPLLWIVYLALQTWAWHALVRAATILYARARFDDVRARGDVPLGWWAWVRRRVRRKERSA